MQLLIASNKTATAICFESGFSDVAFFHKSFKQYARCTPLAYRKVHLNNLLPSNYE
jgi:AraC-like DNA-binding protein